MTLDDRTVPSHIGRYELVERLAVGGMADVFLACERGAHALERLVVLKRILPHLATEEGFLRMFLQEARIAARIRHPNVVQIYELGEDGLPYIAMEYVQGVTLRDVWLAARNAGVPVPVGVAIGLVAQACAGANALHDLQDTDGRPYGLVHRDLTPHNLMVTAEGHVKILDFGIAKAAEGEERTRTGLLKGKIAYMSPEQCRQEHLDRRSDVFALGIVLWELLAGRRLFKQLTEVGTLQAIVSGEVPRLRDIRDYLPVEIEEVVDRALRYDREDRHPSADAMRRALIEAANRVELPIDQDAVADFLQRVLGTRFEAHRQHVERALEQSMFSVSHPVGEAEDREAEHTVTAPIRMLGAAGAALMAVLIVLGGATGAGLLALTLWRGDGEQAYVPPDGPPVRMAFAPVFSDEIRSRQLEPLRRWLEQRIDRPIELVVPPSYADTSRMLLDGEVDFASLPPNLYIETHAADGRVAPLVVHVIDGSRGSDGLLLVREGIDARTIADVAGLRICYSDPSSTTGYRLPRIAMERAGLDPDAAFTEVVFSGSHPQVIRDLVDGRCDVGATYSGAYQTASNDGIAVATTRMLATTGRTPHDAICAGPTTDADLAARLREALLAFDPVEVTGGPRLGDIELITGFVPGDDDDYHDLREVLATAEEEPEPAPDR